MQLKSVLLSCLAAPLLLLASPTPIEDTNHLEARAGPSGYLNFPPGGTHFQIDLHGNLHLSYHQVSYVDTVDPINSAQTMSIDVNLEALDSFNKDATLVTGLSVNSNTSDINGWFVPQVSCGNYRLAIYEWQLYGYNIIRFRSAAPTITIDC
ncbi:hypothetical protein T439DRAFT_323813 [Meredithblackwellia eburnea MCA 4105]